MEEGRREKREGKRGRGGGGEKRKGDERIVKKRKGG